MAREERKMTMKDMPKDRLYKYYSLSGIESTIKDNTLKWSLLSEVNDPFEAIPAGWDKTSIKQCIPDYQVEDLAHIDALFDAEKVKELISQITSFVSFSECANKILMWAHYAEKFTGACLEFSTEIIQREIDCLERVTYAKPDEERKRCPLPYDDRGDNNPEYQKRVREFLAFKASEWAYEEEWRLIVPPMAKIIRCKREGDKYILVSEIPQGAVTKLIFGYNMPTPTRLALAKQIRVKHPECKFARIVLDSKLFMLSVDDLDVDAVEVAALGK